MSNLPDLVDSHADAHSYNTDWDPENWFDDLRSSIRSLGELFPDDDIYGQALTAAESQIEAKIAELQENREEEEPPDDYRHDAGRAAVSGGNRSIFDDLV